MKGLIFADRAQNLQSRQNVLQILNFVKNKKIIFP